MTDTGWKDGERRSVHPPGPEDRRMAAFIADIDADMERWRAEMAALGVVDRPKKEVRRAMRRRRGHTRDRAGRPM